MRRTLTVSHWLVLLSVGLILAIGWSTAQGTVSISPGRVASIIVGSISIPTAVTSDLTIVTRSLVTTSASDSTRFIVLSIRLPRVLLGAIVGMALAVAGAVMQGFFRNPMADPSIVGVSSGAAVGAVSVVAFFGSAPIALQFVAFLGAILAAFFVYLLAYRRSGTPIATLLLAGVAVQAFLGAIIAFLLLHSGDGLREALFWLMGTLRNSGWAEVWMTLPLVIVCTILLWTYSHELNVLLLGTEEAITLGIDVESVRRRLLALSALVTAIAVSVSGIIGFVGLIVPHIMRLLVGPDHRSLIPTSALAGAIFLVLTDTAARVGLSGHGVELPVGILTAALGAPFFLFLLQRREVRGL